ncbi:HAD-like domain-containing protein [Russula dissimulans]|nr:HAD-like domain-containing protein [Russula dissimulans]
MSLSQFKVLIFDVYGTLVDWETGIYHALSPLHVDLNQEWSKSDVLLAFSSVESDLQAKDPTALYSDILARTYDELSRRIRGQPDLPEASGNTAAPVVVSSRRDAGPEASSGVSQVGTSSSVSETALSPVNNNDDDDDDDGGDGDGATVTYTPPAAATFAASLATWPIFPDTIAALTKLSSSSLGLGLKLVVLSNVDRASFAHTRAALERGFAFAAVYTAEEIGSYKPDLRNLEYAVTRLQAEDPSLERDEILVVAQSLPHDHVPARALGLSSVWIDRSGALTCLDGEGVPTARTAKETFAKWRFRSLGEFANAVEEARAKP